MTALPQSGLEFRRYWAIEEGAMDEISRRLSQVDFTALSGRTPARMPGSSASFRGGVAIIDINGPLLKHPSILQMIFGGTSMATARLQVEAAAADPDVASILLRVDSPGGTVAGTADLAQAVYQARQRKQVVAFIEDLGASAAYWIASQASTIISNSSALVGSIGTYRVVTDASKLAESIGLEVIVIRAGEFKGSGTPGTKITPEQLSEFQRVVNDLNDLFVRGVARGRGMAVDRVRALADGRIHVAAEAKRLGLIDSIGTTFDGVLNDMLANAAADRRRAEASRPVTRAEIISACPGLEDRSNWCQEHVISAGSIDSAKARWAEFQTMMASDQARQTSQPRTKTPPAPTADPVGEFRAAVAAELERNGGNRAAAVSAAVKADPGLHRRFVEATARK